MHFFTRFQTNRRYLRRILINQEKTMSAMEDLTAAVSALADDVSTEIAALAAAIAKPTTPDTSAEIEVQVSKLKDLSAALKASVAPVVPESDPA